MKLSATLGGIGSVAISALPILANTRSTSGISLILASSCCCNSIACCNEVPGIRNACIAISPSSRFGTNSVPKRVASRLAAITSTTAALTASQRKRSVAASTGR